MPPKKAKAAAAACAAEPQPAAAAAEPAEEVLLEDPWAAAEEALNRHNAYNYTPFKDLAFCIITHTKIHSGPLSKIVKQYGGTLVAAPPKAGQCDYMIADAVSPETRQAEALGIIVVLPEWVQETLYDHEGRLCTEAKYFLSKDTGAAKGSKGAAANNPPSEAKPAVRSTVQCASRAGDRGLAPNAALRLSTAEWSLVAHCLDGFELLALGRSCARMIKDLSNPFAWARMPPRPTHSRQLAKAVRREAAEAASSAESDAPSPSLSSRPPRLSSFLPLVVSLLPSARFPSVGALVPAEMVPPPWARVDALLLGQGLPSEAEILAGGWRASQDRATLEADLLLALPTGGGSGGAWTVRALTVSGAQLAQTRALGGLGVLLRRFGGLQELVVESWVPRVDDAAQAAAGCRDDSMDEVTFVHPAVDKLQLKAIDFAGIAFGTTEELSVSRGLCRLLRALPNLATINVHACCNTDRLLCALVPALADRERRPLVRLLVPLANVESSVISLGDGGSKFFARFEAAAEDATQKRAAAGLPLQSPLLIDVLLQDDAAVSVHTKRWALLYQLVNLRIITQEACGESLAQPRFSTAHVGAPPALRHIQTRLLVVQPPSALGELDRPAPLWPRVRFQTFGPAIEAYFESQAEFDARERERKAAAAAAPSSKAKPAAAAAQAKQQPGGKGGNSKAGGKAEGKQQPKGDKSGKKGK